MSTTTLNAAPRVDAPVDPSRKLGLFQRVADFMFGYDFFISYCWADGRHYANELQRQLEGQGFESFLDSRDYAKGDNWRAAGQRALKKTSRLILVGTPMAVLSEPVANELRIFRELGRRVFAIDIGGALSGTGQGIFRYLDPEMLRVNETKTALGDGPSEDVLGQIRRSFDLLRQNQKRVRWFGALTAVFATVAAVAVVFFFVARDQTAKAVQQQTRAVSQLARQATERGDGTTGMLAILGVMPATPHIADASMALLDAWSRHREVATMIGHTGAVISASYSADGKRVVTASADNTARIWDAQSGTEIRVLIGGAKGASFSADGKRVVAVSADNTARIWDAQSGAVIAVLSGPTLGVDRVSFSADGKRVITMSPKETNWVWDQSAADGRWMATKLGEDNGGIGISDASFSADGRHVITSGTTVRVWYQPGADGKWVMTELGQAPQDGKTGFRTADFRAFSADGKRAVTVSADKTAQVWDLTGASGKWTPTKLGEASGVALRDASLSPDGKRVVTVSADDKTAQVWDQSGVNGKWTPTKLGEARGIPLRSASFSPDGKRVITMDDQTVQVWDQSGADGKWASTKLGGDTAPFTVGSYPLMAFFSGDGKRVITMEQMEGVAQRARVWDAQSGAEIAGLGGHTGRVNDALFSPDGQRMVTASDDNTARIWDLSDAGPVATVLGGSGDTGPVSSALFSADGRRVATATAKEVRVWDQSGAEGRWAATKLAEESGGAGLGVSVSADGKRVVTVSDDKKARVWDQSGADGRWAATKLAEESAGAVSHASLSADGKRILTVSDDNTARVWDQSGPDGRWAATKLAKESGAALVNDASLSPDGKRVVTASNDNTARVWDQSGPDGKWTPTKLGEGKAIDSASFSPDGKRVVTVSVSGSDSASTPWVWDQSGADGRWVGAPLLGHTDTVGNASFSPDGKRVVTASHDYTARIWHQSPGADGRWVGVVLGGHPGVVSASFSPDGKWVATATAGEVRVWDLSGAVPLATVLSGSDATPMVSGASFSLDGKRVVTVSRDGNAIIHPLPTDDELVVLAQRSITRCLTLGQREALGLSVEIGAGTDHARIRPPPCDGEVSSGAAVASDAAAGPSPASGVTPAPMTSKSPDVAQSATEVEGAAAASQPAPAPVFGDPRDRGEREIATPVAPKDPRPRLAHRPQPINHMAANGKGVTTSQLNQQELARHRSVASPSDNPISSLFRSLFR